MQTVAKKKKGKNENLDKIGDFNHLLEKHRDHVQVSDVIDFFLRY